MKRYLILPVLLTLLITMLLAAAAAEAPAVTLSETELTVARGKTATVEITAFPEGMNKKKAVWTTSDKKVATVTNGKVKAVACGECDIICTAAEDKTVQAVCHVTVIQMIQSLQIKTKKLTVAFGESGKAEVTIKPQDATNTKLEWTSSDTGVCKVDKDGKITAVAAGDCEITCAATDGSGKTAKVSVHVPIFEKAAETAEISEQGETVLPLDLHGADLLNISHKASDSKAFLYQVASDGLHIFPLAEGTAKITLTSLLDKKDQMVYTVTVKKQAVFVPTADDPVQIIIVSDRSAIRAGEKVTFSYQVLGKPESIASVTVSLPSLFGSASSTRYPPALKGKASGTFTVETNRAGNASSVIFSVTATGEKHKNYKGRCEVPVSNALVFSAISDTFIAKRGTPFALHFRLSGGVGPYEIEFLVNNERQKVKTEGTGTLEITPGDEKSVSITALIVTDSKKHRCDSPITINIPVTDREPAKIDVSRAFDIVDGVYTLAFVQSAPGTNLKLQMDDRYNDGQLIKPEADGATYLISLTDENKGFYLTSPDRNGTDIYAGIYAGHLK